MLCTKEERNAWFIPKIIYQNSPPRITELFSVDISVGTGNTHTLINLNVYRCKVCDFSARLSIMHRFITDSRPAVQSAINHVASYSRFIDHRTLASFLDPLALVLRGTHNPMTDVPHSYRPHVSPNTQLTYNLNCAYDEHRINIKVNAVTKSLFSLKHIVWLPAYYISGNLLLVPNTFL